MKFQQDLKPGEKGIALYKDSKFLGYEGVNTPEKPSIDTLEKSMHLAIVKAIDIDARYPIKVMRRFYDGQLTWEYEYDCLVTETVRKLIQTNELAAGDHVLVEYIEDSCHSGTIPPIIMDKLAL